MRAARRSGGHAAACRRDADEAACRSGLRGPARGGRGGEFSGPGQLAVGGRGGGGAAAAGSGRAGVRDRAQRVGPHRGVGGRGPEAARRARAGLAGRGARLPADLARAGRGKARSADGLFRRHDSRVPAAQQPPREPYRAGRSGNRARQDAGIPGAGLAVGAAQFGARLDFHFYQEFAAPARAGGAPPGGGPAGAPQAHRDPQGPGELSVPAQHAGGLRAHGGAGGKAGAAGGAGRAVGAPYARRRHGRRRFPGLADGTGLWRGDGRGAAADADVAGADGPAGRMHLFGLPALPAMLHRARRACRAQGRSRRGQPCAGAAPGGGRPGARQRHSRGRPGPAGGVAAHRLRRGPPSVRCRGRRVLGPSHRLRDGRAAALDPGTRDPQPSRPQPRRPAGRPDRRRRDGQGSARRGREPRPGAGGAGVAGAGAGRPGRWAGGGFPGAGAPAGAGARRAAGRRGASLSRPTAGRRSTGWSRRRPACRGCWEASCSR
jgi:hypothetical protein